MAPTLRAGPLSTPTRRPRHDREEVAQPLTDRVAREQARRTGPDAEEERGRMRDTHSKSRGGCSHRGGHGVHVPGGGVLSGTMRATRSVVAIGLVAALAAGCGSAATTAPAAPASAAPASAAPAASVAAPASAAAPAASAAAASTAPAASAAAGAMPSPVLTADALSKWTTSNPYKAAFIYVGAPSDAG